MSGLAKVDLQRIAFTSCALLDRQVVQKAEHVSDMKECFPVPGFGVPQIDDSDKLSRRAILSQKLVQMGMLESGVLAGLPIRGNSRVTIGVLPGGRALLNIDSGQLIFHALCSTRF